MTFFPVQLAFRALEGDLTVCEGVEDKSNNMLKA